AVAAAALGIAFGLKAFYSRAGAGELSWVLAPTVRLVEWGAGASFTFEPHRGWLCRERLFEILPAGAGVHLPILALFRPCLALAAACRSAAERAALVLGSAVAAYATTVLANATRIAVAMHVHDTPAVSGPLAPSRQHEVLGVVVYCAFLAGLFAAASR